jgi:hypothetical protein
MHRSFNTTDSYLLEVNKRKRLQIQHFHNPPRQLLHRPNSPRQHMEHTPYIAQRIMDVRMEIPRILQIIIRFAECVFRYHIIRKT